MTDPDCIFCRIVAGTSPASFVHRSERVVAFLDIAPVTPGHLLVVPTTHAPGLADVAPPLLSEMAVVAQQMAASLRASGLRCEGVNLFYADGEAAFQEVFHAHLHVIPRFAGDGFRLHIDRTPTPSRTELDDIARKLTDHPAPTID